MRRHPLRSILALTTLSAVAPALLPASSYAADPEPGTPAYVARDAQNIADAYGRITGPGGQLQNPAYLPALAWPERRPDLAADQAGRLPDPAAVTPGSVFPGWNVGNPLRAGWKGTRGLSERISFTNRYGALLRGTVYRPAPGARDPYTGRALSGPFPGVVITPGLGAGLRGHVRVAGPGPRRARLRRPHLRRPGPGRRRDVPARAPAARTTRCRSATRSPRRRTASSTAARASPPSSCRTSWSAPRTPCVLHLDPARRYANPRSAGAEVTSHNPYWRLFDRSADRARTPRPDHPIAIIGHSMGAAAVSKVQGTDRRVAAVVALDKLAGPGDRAARRQRQHADRAGTGPAVRVRVHRLAVPRQRRLLAHPAAQPRRPGPAARERTGFDAWREAGIDSMLVVPRASTHLEYTDIPLVLPASR